MKDIYFIFRREFYLVFRDHAVLTFFIFLCLGYPLIYTFIYSNEVVRQVPVAVIDQSKSPLSREFLRMWEASPNVKVVAHCNDLGEAQLFMWQKEIYGILEIPADFSKDINRGEQAHVALFCDMGALLNYKALLQATSDVAITLGKEIQVENLPYASRIQQEITASPVEISEVKMFNPQSGFASFIIPAVLILVIQQSLLLGVGTIAGTARDRNPRHSLVPVDKHYCKPWCIVIGKACVYMPVYFVMGFWVFFIVPRIFSLTQIGAKSELMLFLFPFLLACVFFAIAASFLSIAFFIVCLYLGAAHVYFGYFVAEGGDCRLLDRPVENFSFYSRNRRVRKNEQYGGYPWRGVAGVSKSLDFSDYLFYFGMFIVL